MTTILHNDPGVNDLHTSLEEDTIEAELILWEVLRNNKLCGKTFKRQHAIGHYIADFYCSSEKLIIELVDQHLFTNNEKTKEREKEYRALMGKKVLRFKDEEVINTITEVVRQIKNAFRDREKLGIINLNNRAAMM